MAAKSTLNQVLAMLEERADICLMFSDQERIFGFQMRRYWVKETTHTTFSEVEKEEWRYYGQAFEIMEKKLNRAGDLQQSVGEAAFRVGKMGGWFIIADPDAPLDAVVERLGSVPENFADYLARKLK